MTSDEAVAELNSLDHHDPESAHGRADDILIEVLKQLAPKVAAAWEQAAERVGFWYA